MRKKECEMSKQYDENEKLFSLGKILATRGVYKEMVRSLKFMDFVRKSLARHLRGDWGDLCPEDWDANQKALQHEGRLFSAYQEEGLPRIWIITEADRSATTVLFPDEY